MTIIYRYSKNSEIPEQLNEMKYKVIHGDYKLFGDVEYDPDKFEPTIKFNNYEVMLGDYNPKLFMRNGARGDYVQLGDGKNWLLRTIKDIDYSYSYDATLDKIVKIFDNSGQINIINNLISKGDAMSEEDILELIADSLIRNYCITREMIFYLKLINSKNINELVNSLLCVELLKKEGFFRESTNEV